MEQAAWLHLARLAPAVAHDLRAPINTMSIQLAVMEETAAADAAAEPERRKRRLAVLREELSRLHTRLEAFFALLGRTRGIQEIDLRGPVADLELLLAALARPRRIGVSLRTGEEPVPVAAEGPRLRQALLAAGMKVLDGLAPEAGLELALEACDGRALLSVTGGPWDEPAEGGVSEAFPLAAWLATVGATLSPLAGDEDTDGLLIELPLASVSPG